MPDFQDAIQQHQDLPVEAQKQAGKALPGDMEDEHVHFLETILKMLDTKQIDPADPKSLLTQAVYDKLSQEWKDKTDLALINIADQLERIIEFRLSEQTPDSSPQLATMIEHLWQMKQRIEEKGPEFDVFKF